MCIPIMKGNFCASFTYKQKMHPRHRRISGEQGISSFAVALLRRTGRMWISGEQGIRLLDIRGTGILWHGHPGRVSTFHGLEARATREGLLKNAKIKV